MQRELGALCGAAWCEARLSEALRQSRENGAGYRRARFLALAFALDLGFLAWRVRSTFAVGLALRALLVRAGFLRAAFFLAAGMCISAAKACCADSTLE